VTSQAAVNGQNLPEPSPEEIARVSKEMRDSPTMQKAFLDDFCNSLSRTVDLAKMEKWMGVDPACISRIINCLECVQELANNLSVPKETKDE